MNEQFVFQKFLQMIKTIANPFLVLPALFLGYGSIGMVVVTTILSLSIKIANAIFCFKKLNMEFKFRNFDFSLMREMTVFSSFIFINMIVDQINWNVDKFLLGRFQGTVSVAIYGLATQILAYYASLSTAVSKFFWKEIMKFIPALTLPNLSRNCYTVFTGFIKHCRFPNLRIIILSSIWRSGVVVC